VVILATASELTDAAAKRVALEAPELSARLSRDAGRA
jgi:L-aminopeptidase/D-esterase-like protein